MLLVVCVRLHTVPDTYVKVLYVTYIVTCTHPVRIHKVITGCISLFITVGCYYGIVHSIVYTMFQERYTPIWRNGYKTCKFLYNNIRSSLLPRESTTVPNYHTVPTGLLITCNPCSALMTAQLLYT